MFCELCGGYSEELKQCKISTDGADIISGEYCPDCRHGRIICPLCTSIVPGHSTECPAKP